MARLLVACGNRPRRLRWRRFSSEEKELARELYTAGASLNQVSRDLGRSPVGVFKILKAAGVEVRSNRKIKSQLRERIGLMYYKDCLSCAEIGRFLWREEGLLLSKSAIRQTVLKWKPPWLEKVDRLTGGQVKLANDGIDLLPFASRTDLRWVDTDQFLLRFENSLRVTIRRKVDIDTFGYCVGFYAAEGNKGKGPPGIVNTNFDLLSDFAKRVSRFASSSVRNYYWKPAGNRLGRRTLFVSGECFKRFMKNSIESIMRFLSTEANVADKNVVSLYLSFLRGYADGDGSVAIGGSRNARPEMTFYITEGNGERGVALKLIFRRFFGKGYLYRPRGRNYDLVELSLTPDDALTLLRHSFFQRNPEMRGRLFRKALQCVEVRRLIFLHEKFGRRRFSMKEVLVYHRAPAWFLSRVAERGWVDAQGVEMGGSQGAHWYRSYRLSSEGQRIIEALAQVGKVGGKNRPAIC